jgi:hypothetical protein
VGGLGDLHHPRRKRHRLAAHVAGEALTVPALAELRHVRRLAVVEAEAPCEDLA